MEYHVNNIKLLENIIENPDNYCQNREILIQTVKLAKEGYENAISELVTEAQKHIEPSDHELNILYKEGLLIDPKAEELNKYRTMVMSLMDFCVKLMHNTQ